MQPRIHWRQDSDVEFYDMDGFGLYCNVLIINYIDKECVATPCFNTWSSHIVNMKLVLGEGLTEVTRACQNILDLTRSVSYLKMDKLINYACKQVYPELQISKELHNKIEDKLANVSVRMENLTNHRA